MYTWRRLSDDERAAVLEERQRRGGSWRRPPVWTGGGTRFLMTSACFEHAAFIGYSAARMTAFEKVLLYLLDGLCAAVFAHVVLPNHYHAVVDCGDVSALRRELGRLHGRTSRGWNLEEQCLGRKVFHGSTETRMKSEGHFHASVNYVHHNPVMHGYVEKWTDWPWSSAQAYLDTVGIEEARREWKAYPVGDFGADWDR